MPLIPALPTNDITDTHEPPTFSCVMPRHRASTRPSTFSPASSTLATPPLLRVSLAAARFSPCRRSELRFSSHRREVVSPRSVDSKASRWIAANPARWLAKKTLVSVDRRRYCSGARHPHVAAATVLAATPLPPPSPQRVRLVTAITPLLIHRLCRICPTAEISSRQFPSSTPPPSPEAPPPPSPHRHLPWLGPSAALTNPGDAIATSPGRYPSNPCPPPGVRPLCSASSPSPSSPSPPSSLTSAALLCSPSSPLLHALAPFRSVPPASPLAAP